MFFNSFSFILVFLPITVLGYFFLNHRHLCKLGLVWLLAASLIFYSWWNLAFLPIFLISMAANFTLGRFIIGNRLLLFVGVAANLGLLAYFKYLAFFLENAGALTGHNLGPQSVVLPLAISFFTIQQIVYLIDTYDGLTPKAPLLDYLVYVSFFPHLIAGPIVQHNELMPQLPQLRKKLINFVNIAMGLLLFSIGLAKKVILADTLAGWAKTGFDGSQALGFLDGWVASLSYTFQLYFDFSGYSDMAIGLGLLFNIKMPTNFRSPYRAKSIVQFWQGWHITLSRFIASYLYTPILKSMPKATFVRSMFATFIAMLIAGIWHGADWRFVLFGAMHGAGLVVNHLWKKRKMPKVPSALAWALTFFWVNLAFVFFRAKTWTDALRVLRGMFAPPDIGSVGLVSLFFLITSFIVVMTLPNVETFMSKQKPSWRNATLTALLLYSSFLFLEFQNASEFLYFKF